MVIRVNDWKLSFKEQEHPAWASGRRLTSMQRYAEARTTNSVGRVMAAADWPSMTSRRRRTISALMRASGCLIVVNGGSEPLQDYIQAPVKVDVCSFRPQPLT